MSLPTELNRRDVFLSASPVLQTLIQCIQELGLSEGFIHEILDRGVKYADPWSPVFSTQDVFSIVDILRFTSKEPGIRNVPLTDLNSLIWEVCFELRERLIDLSHSVDHAHLIYKGLVAKHIVLAIHRS